MSRHRRTRFHCSTNSFGFAVPRIPVTPALGAPAFSPPSACSISSLAAGAGHFDFAGRPVADDELVITGYGGDRDVAALALVHADPLHDSLAVALVEHAHELRCLEAIVVHEGVASDGSYGVRTGLEGEAAG